MTEPSSSDRTQRLLADLHRLVVERATAEDKLSLGTRVRSETAENEFQETQRRLAEQYRTQKAAAEKEYASVRSRIQNQFQEQRHRLETEFEAAREAAHQRYADDLEAAKKAQQDAHWEATEAVEAARGGLNLPVQELLTGLEERWRQLEAIHQQAVELLQWRGHWEGLPPAAPTPVVFEKHPGRRFCHALEQAQSQYRILDGQRLPLFLHGLRPLGIFFLFWAVAAIPFIAWFGWADWRWAPSSCAIAAFFGGPFGLIMARIAKRRSTQAYLALRQTMLQAGVGHETVLEGTKTECQRLDATINARYQQKIQEADELFAADAAALERRRQNSLRELEIAHPRQLTELSTWRDRMLHEADAKYPPLLRQLDDRFAEESERLRANHLQSVEQERELFDSQYRDMLSRWQSGIEQFSAAANQASRTWHETFPNWNTDDWNRWTPPDKLRPFVTFGSTRIALSGMKRGMPADKKLWPAQTDFELPIDLPFPRHSLLLLKAGASGKSKAIELMQSAMLRLLTALPPGKVRFTIIDPIGLGDNFSAFMHLADFDEQLVASRIWTDTAHIEQRLADLTKHMENVIQVYLRQEFHSIEEYNASAGELAEPYRVLVVANFPANFSEAAAHRIKSIVSSGARCGVFVLLSIDDGSPPPRNFQFTDLESEGLILRWEGGRFVLDHRDLGPLPLDFDPPPPPERFKEIVRTIGSAAKDSGRVEVPFSHIIPDESDWWTADSRAGIDVPLGRAGAMKLQHLDLGHGTSQHVLISGKTGSGKSTLLHVLITNLALRYSPDEVELYLVDFKKGVEFKAYARSLLPHARVIAIESEREFGLSVLQRLDAELRTRGDLFRKRGTQDVKGYRTAEPDARMPRILLMIDEFQELFVEDDRIAQESALLLDRLVRQGRAFGIHVLLGSQTLGGAYTLARSTIGQMAVRIALQCSEADAHLILSEDNTAARLLTRPGEAIYNDANGLYEGNHPFQIVWLPDGDRDDYLRRISQLAERRNTRSTPPIVFEGNILANLDDNPILHDAIAAKQRPPKTAGVSAWLGSAVAIKEPTAAVFLPQNGSNLLIVGHREEAALGVLSACFVSLAAQHPPEGAKFHILDGMRADAPEIGFWNRLTEISSHQVHIAGTRNPDDVLAELAAELAARQQSGHEDVSDLYLLIYNLARFRPLRKEDDFGYSMGGDDQPPSTAKQFATILREGPPHRIHTLIWCDTYSNAARMLDRQSMQDFEMRVLFQMNANDSSALMDSPEASRLGVHRAILYDEGQGIAEKFRPYGIPSNEYLAWVKEQLTQR